MTQLNNAVEQGTLDNPLKVLLISPLPPPAGGIASWTAAILPKLSSYCDLEISHVDTAIRWWRTPSDRSTIKRIIVGVYQAFLDIRRTRSRMLASRPDVIHLCTSGSLATFKDIQILRMGRRRGIRTVIHFRMGRLPQIVERNGWEWRVTRRAMETADTVLVLDRESVRAVGSVLPHVSLRNIPNPVDCEMVDRIPAAGDREDRGEGIRRIIYVGHLIPSKGLDDLVRACLLLEPEPIELDLVGPIEDDYRQALQHIAGSRRNGHWLRFLGQLDRTEAIGRMRDADLFVLPSHSEGFPNVILEAMALGKPIVATAVGAVPEMLDSETDHPCGAVVPPHDVGALHAALQAMVSDPDRAGAFGRRARDKVRSSYSMERALDEYVNLWHSVAKPSVS